MVINKSTGREYADLGSKNWTPKNQPTGGSTGGTSVSIKEENIVKSEIAGINQVAISGGSGNIEYKVDDKPVTESQYEEVRTQELNPPTVYIDTQAVKQYNDYMASQGIKNAGEYFNAVRNPTPSQPSHEVINSQTMNQRLQTPPPRRVAPGETTPVTTKTNFQNPFQNTPSGGEIHADQPNQGKIKRPWAAELNFQIDLAQTKFSYAKEQPGNELLVLASVPASFVYGVYTGARDFGSGIKTMIQEQIKEPNPFNIVSQIGSGVAEQTSRIVTDVSTGNIPGLSQEAGVIYSQAKISKGGNDLVKGAFKDFGQNLQFQEITSGRDTPTAPPENPAFVRQWESMGINDMTPINNPKEYLMIPTEQTELGRSFSKETTINPDVIDSSAGELTPGRWLVESQPKSTIEKQFYERKGNEPTELQTRLSSKEPIISQIPERSAQEILESSKGTRQTKITDKFKTPPDIVMKNPNENIIKKPGPNFENSPIYATQPLMAAGLILVEETPRISDLLKEKYAVYKKSMEGGNAEIIIREAPSSNIRNPDFLPISVSKINNPGGTPTQIPSGVSLVKYQPTQRNINPPKINMISKGRTESQSKIKSDIKTDIQPMIIGSIGTETKTETRTEQATAQITEQTQIQETRLIQEPIQIQETTTTQKPPFMMRPSNKEDRKNKSPFTVKVRRRGVFQTIGTENDLSSAINKAEGIVQRTAAASFKLEQNNQPIKNIQVGKQFRPSKKESGVYIQQNKFRISSPGEKAEITNLGILATKKQNRRRNKWEF
jgi:hypothetical protein